MIPHTFRVHYTNGVDSGHIDFTGHNRRARARGFAIVKQAAGYETRIEPVGYLIMFHSFAYQNSTIHTGDTGTRVQYPDNTSEDCRTVEGAKRKASAWVKRHPHAGRFWFSLYGHVDSERFRTYLTRAFDPADFFARGCHSAGYGLYVRRLDETVNYRVHGFSNECGPLKADGSPIFNDWA